MATVQGADLIDVIVDGGESAKSLNRPGLQRLMALVNGGKVQAVIVAKLDRLTRSVKDLCGLLELFEKRKVALISVAESLDTGSAAGRLVITIMGAVSQWEREAIGERTRDALRHKRGNGERVGNIEFGFRLAPDGRHVEPDAAEQAAQAEIRNLRRQGHTLRGIAMMLNGHGYRTRRGTDWRLESVARILKQNVIPPHAKTALGSEGACFDSTNGISSAIQLGIRDHDRSEAVPQVKLHCVPLFGNKLEIFPERQLAHHSTLDFLSSGCPVCSMMLVIFGILLVDLEFILCNIHKLCSEEHITDPSNFADRAE
jgi:DNA invertase Pin-like site-specific DNA recombinase